MRAPSALGNNADINPMIKMTDITAGIWLKRPRAMEGNKLSPVILRLL